MPPTSTRPRKNLYFYLFVLFAFSAPAACTQTHHNEGGECVFNGDCENPLVCAGTFCRAQCESDRDCPMGTCSAADAPMKRVCLPWGAALLCTEDSQCVSGARCGADHSCHAPCSTNADCGAGGSCNSSGLCSDPVRVSDSILVPRPDASMDARTDATLDVPDAGPDVAPDASPDAFDAPACNADLQNDPLNCGACGTVCPAGNHAAASCVTGRCALLCAPNFADCNASATDGCEADLRSDLTHCGACSFACPSTPAHATPTCTPQGCGLVCATGYLDCDGALTDGCEADPLSDHENCGGCFNRCGTMQVCTNGQCQDALACADASFSDDPNNCGGCGMRCPILANTTPSCSVGVCGLSCNAGFANCNGSMSDGCETDTTSAANCGRCGNVCPAGSACVAGACAGTSMVSSGAEGPFAPTVDTVLTPGVHQFTTIDIPAGVTVRVSGSGIVELWATGSVVIDGTIDVSGGDGGSGATYSPVPPGCNGGGGETGTTIAGAMGVLNVCAPGGAGGSGVPGSANTGQCGPGGAFGGGGGGRTAGCGGGGGGYAGGGGGAINSGPCNGGSGASGSGSMGGAGGIGSLYGGGGGEPNASGQYAGQFGGGRALAVGNGGGGSIGADAIADLAVAQTFRPGSGGGGGSGIASSQGDSGGGGGGGGGGAVRIVSLVSVSIGPTGRVLANGGEGGYSGTGGFGGSGSGGVIYIASPMLNMQGTLSAVGGTVLPGATGTGGLGRIRLSVDPRQCTLDGTLNPGKVGGCTPTPAPGYPGFAYIGVYPE